jgi:hypothetical protein
MNDFSSMQFVIGAYGCLVLAILGAFVVYWYVFAKKHIPAPQLKIMKSNTPKNQISSSVSPALNTTGE